MDIKKNHLNFAVGPVPIDKEISALGSEPVPYFRTAEFSSLMLENEKLFLQLLHAPSDARAVFLTGSGTSAMDASISSVFTENDRLLIVKGGSFGARFCEIAECYGVPYEAIELQTGKTLKEEDLAPFEGADFTGFMINMDETSTGVLYDMNLVGDFCRRNGLFLVVDIVSAFLSDPFDMTDCGADIAFTGAQKALAVPPGVALMAISARAQKKIEKAPERNYYLSLKKALKNQERGQTPWTPAVGTLIQINARLNAISAAGLEKTQNAIRSVAEDFRSKIRMYPFHIVSDRLPNAVTPLSPNNPDVSAHHLFEVLMAEYDIVICPNGGDLKDTLFRVGHIGAHTTEDNDILLRAFDDLMARGILKA